MKIGLAISFPAGLYARIAPRSGLALKKFIYLGAGVVDRDYRGDVGVVLFNHGDQEFEVKMGDRIAQMIFEKIDTPEVVEVQGLEDTVRGAGGFGSTGIKTNDTDGQILKQNVQAEKNETLKSKYNARPRTDRDGKRTEKEVKLSHEREIISINKLKNLIQKKEPVFFGSDLGTRKETSQCCSEG